MVFELDERFYEISEEDAAGVVKKFKKDWKKGLKALVSNAEPTKMGGTDDVYMLGETSGEAWDEMIRYFE